MKQQFDKPLCMDSIARNQFVSRQIAIAFVLVRPWISQDKFDAIKQPLVIRHMTRLKLRKWRRPQIRELPAKVSAYIQSLIRPLCKAPKVGPCPKQQGHS